MSDVNFHGGPFEPNMDPAPAPGPVQPRPSLGAGYDWLLELARQIYRPVLAGICVLGLSRHFLWAAPADRLDQGSLVILAGLAATLAGLRGAELFFGRR